uniref:Uncharacterized protein n=1 Tax=Anguilla anguilla TaxID=7936 RepID=A0A0E9XGS6_ANGAN
MNMGIIASLAFGISVTIPLLWHKWQEIIKAGTQCSLS